MSKILKIYRLKTAFGASVPVILKNGKKRYIRFTGGSRAARTRGFFSTNNEELQRALEADECFNVVYELEAEHNVSTEQSESTSEMKQPIEMYLIDVNTAIHDSSVTSKKMARAFIQAEFGGVLPSDPVTVEEMKQYAAQNYNVVFDKWA